MLQGLANSGNTCSINTMIQCLGHCPAFLDLLLKKEITYKKKENHHYSIYEELKRILKELWIDNHSLLPKRFLKAFYESIGNMYQPGEQFDFTEMWMLLLNNLIEETHTKEDILKIHLKDHGSDALNYIQHRTIQAWTQFVQKNNSPIMPLFHGMQVQQIRCKNCQKTYHNLEPMSFIYLELNKDTFKECMDDFFDTETLTDWTCDHCKYQQAEKFIRFWSLPKVWMIVLKRFNHQHKIGKPMDIPLTFKMNSLHSDDLKSYELKSIANHYGSLYGGHYNAICKNEDQHWYEYDDLQVRKIEDIRPHLHQNYSAYALFYEC